MLFISRYLRQHQAKYIHLLHQTLIIGTTPIYIKTNCLFNNCLGIWQPMIEFFCDALEWTCKTERDLLIQTKDLFEKEDKLIEAKEKRYATPLNTLKKS